MKYHFKSQTNIYTIELNLFLNYFLHFDVNITLFLLKFVIQYYSTPNYNKPKNKTVSTYLNLLVSDNSLELEFLFCFLFSIFFCN